MAWNKEDLIEYDDEVMFQVGQFVDVDLPEIPVENRDCTWGVIIAIRTRFPLSPEFRSIYYTVKFAGDYIIKEKRLLGGIKGQIQCLGKNLKRIEQ